jgi:hypothetical protein
MLLLVITWLSVPTAAAAEQPAKTAAGEFDAGVRFFDAAEYPAAARAFLRADRLAPNSEAVANAITSALKTTDYLLVVEAAERGVERAQQDAALAAKARQALARAREHLAEIEMTCSPSPCSLRLDGVGVQSGSHFVLPGTHTVSASGSEGVEAPERRQSFEVGTRYQIHLDVADPGPAAPTPAPVEPESEAASSATAGTAIDEAPAAGVDPAWFYVGAGVSTVLAGLTIWSGLDTLSANDAAGDRAPKSQIDAIRAKAQRTDLLLAGTVVAVGVTGYVGVVLVDWAGDAKDPSTRSPQGAILTWGRAF